MKMNMINFKEWLNKASINYLIPSISMNMEENIINVASRSSDNNAFVFLKRKNDIIDTKEQIEFNFADISTNIKPYIDLIQDEIVDIKIEENHIIIKDSKKKKIKLFFCTKEFTNHFTGQDKSASFDYFYETQLSKEILAKFNEIKKVAVRFGKIYFVCKDGKFFIESTDKTNNFSNSIDLELDDVNKKLDISMCFDYKNINYILNTINGNIDNFKMKCTYIEDSDAGMVLFENREEEKYFITSKTE